ncbi:helix-turn-helix transcriptional regulator [Amycolatopsis arida]|uniref:helix-turn-helix transcriptional regulator n=1 Tax=Amycolatopsis arida TaxID=587909 RepID=UPI000B8568DD|nr:helix-turn-helix transcriptional regulator [Amycolatopsis arida]
MLRRAQQLAGSATAVQGALALGRSRRNRPDLALLEMVTDGGKQRRLLVDSLARTDPMGGETGRRHLEIRVYAPLSRPMLVFDDRYAVLALDQAQWSAGALLLRAPLAGTCSELFELQWSAARPLTAEPPRPKTLSGRQRDVVNLLLQGATDHQVAARLGVSSRTVRNVVSQLQRRFGTTSRMALGFRLARLATTPHRDDRPA